MIGRIIKKVRNVFHVPGEDIIILGFDDRCKSIRRYDLWTKTANKFDNKLEGKTIEGNVAQPFITYPDKKLSEPSAFDAILDQIQNAIPIPERFRFTPIFTSEETGDEIVIRLNRRYGHIFKTNDKPEGIAYLCDMQTGQGGQLVPKQIKVERDPVIDMLFSVNPFFWGSTIDSFIATELLRGKVEWWKTLLFMGVALILGLILGAGM